MMATNSQYYNVDASSRPTTRDRSPDSPVGRSGCCNGFLRFGSRKRGKRVVPAARMQDSTIASTRHWGANGASQSGASNQYASLSPSLLAPPSSPSSFQNSAVQSSAQSPSTFAIALSVPSSTSQIPLEATATMFQMGPYAHETALVSPPVFSTFTTAPSTAPFTPPPELATHVTTPSSPDVPYAQMLASSFGAKGSSRLQPLPTPSASSFVSPDVFPTDDLQAAYQLFPGSPLAHLLSPNSGTGESTPVPDLEISSQCASCPDFDNSVQAVATMVFPGSSLISSTAGTLDAESLLLQALNSSTFPEIHREEQQLSTTISSFLESGDDPSKQKLVSFDLGDRSITSMTDEKDGVQHNKCLTIFGSCRDYTRILKSEIESKGECGEEQDAGLSGCLADHVYSVEHQQGKPCSFDEADRNLGHITVICNIGFAEAARKCPSMASCSGTTVTRECHSSKFNGDSGAWGNISSDKTTTKSAIPGISKMEDCRSQSATHIRSTSNDSTAWSGPTAVFELSDSADFLRLHHAAGVVRTKVYFENSSPNQLDSAG